MGESAPPFESQHLVSSVAPPPVPIDAQYTAGTSIAVITFDVPLIPGPLNPANWIIQIAGQAYPPFAAPIAAGSTVAWRRSAVGAPCPPTNDVLYDAIPPDVRELGGAPAIAFAIPWHA